MQFVRNGPNVPELLLQAHETNRLVFFCGAGISYPAGLPGFRGLVRRIYSEIGIEPNAVEKAALKAASYDTAISLLEGRVVGDRGAVRKALARALTPTSITPKATQTHESLITLAKGTNGQFRLITTNFDRLFEIAAEKLGVQIHPFQAPLLPVPKNKWRGLVYLHGLLPEKPTQTDLDKLVISSGDFGLAYLVERWAARFVSELFRNYTVCFVGYSLSDPVMRYMMDALAADRQLGEKPREVFAFGNYEKGREDKAALEWAAKNVTPILYRNHNRHSYLHATLKAWADTYRDGIRGKENIIARNAKAVPTGSTIQDNFVGRVLWALSDETGLPAKHFADLNPAPPLDWLEAFSEARFLHGDLVRFGVTANDEEDSALSYSLVSRPGPYTRTPWMSLVHWNPGRSTKWDAVMQQIGRWLSSHIADPRLILWVAKRGGHLDENFEFFIEQALELSPPPEPLASLWRLIIAGRHRDASNQHDLYKWGRAFSKAGLTPAIRMELRRVLTPKVQIREGYPWDSGNDQITGSERFNRAIDWEIVFDSDFAHSALDEISKSAKWQNGLPSLVGQAADLLHEAMDLMAELGGASARSDRSHWHQPSIGRHAQNQKFRDWTVLIDLLRDAWLANSEVAPDIASREVHRWMEICYPVFRRLAFFAAAEKPELFRLESVLNWIVSEDRWWLWATETQREILRLMAAIAPTLTLEYSKDLGRAILAGFPAGMFDLATSPEQIERLQEREIWRRLSTLREGGAKLEGSVESALDTLLKKHPSWGTLKESDEFPVWVGDDGDWQKSSQTPRSRKELEDWLRDNSAVDDVHSEDDFRERCRSDMAVTIKALVSLSCRGIWPTDRWRQALHAWSDETFAKRAWRRLECSLSAMPNDVFEKIASPVAYHLKAAAKHVAGKKETFFSLVRRILDAYRGEQKDVLNDPISDAINHPVGYVTEALLTWWYAQSPKLADNQGLDEPIRSLFEAIAVPSVFSFRHGRLLLCTNIITLFRVDPNWTSAKLLPLFDWRTSADASAAWSGFLWSPRLYWPLLAALKEPFLQTVDHYDELGELADQYVGLLTFAAIERQEPFNSNDFAVATAKLPDEGLAHALRIVSDGLRRAADRRNDYWNNRGRPYFRAIWPKTQTRRTARVSNQFAELLVSADEAFPEALATLRDWILPLGETSFALHQLEESGLSARFPGEALEFMSLLVPHQIPWSAGPIKGNLQQIRQAQPDLASDARFARLETTIRQSGLTL